MKLGATKKPLLALCIALSFLFHVGVIWFFVSHPVYLDSRDTKTALKPTHNPTLIPKEQDEILVERIEKALEESLNNAQIASHAFPENRSTAWQNDVFQDEEMSEEETEPPVTKTLFVSKASIREGELAFVSSAPSDFASSMPPPFDPDFEASLRDFALDDEIEESSLSYESEKSNSIDLTQSFATSETPSFSSALEDDFTLTDQQFFPSSMPTHDEKGLTPDFISLLKRLKTPKMELSEEISEEKVFSELKESSAPKLILPNSVDYLRSQWVKRSLAERNLPDLDFYGLGEISTQLEWEEDVDVDFALMSLPEGNKYVFSLTFYPEFATEHNPMQQNFYFIIDRSSSVEKHKFNRYKRAVQRAMAALHEGDHFNIFVFDKNISKLSDRTLPVTPKTIERAEDFLEDLTSKPHFASGEIFDTIEKVLPSQLDPDQLHSVILITNGNTSLSSQKQKSALSTWAKKFEGLVNFYASASGKGNNLVLLDLLSYCTGGKMLYSDTNAGFPRKLVHLIKDLHNPLVKNVHVEVTPSDPNAQVRIHPNASFLPPMFANQPYTLTGTIDELCDLTVFIQGRNHDKWLNIRKPLSLKNAPQGGRSLEKTWASTQAKMCYDHFLKNGKSTHLKEAVEIVSPYRGVIASEQ